MEMLGWSATWLSGLASKFLEAIFPPACINCGTGGFWCCDHCFQSIDFDVVPPDIDGVDRVRIIGSYANPALRKLLTNYKYRSATCFEPILKRLVGTWKDQRGEALEGDWIIIPTPTDEKHVLERGFDHTEHLAMILRDCLSPHARVVKLLRRNRKTEANAHLHDHELRKGNLKGVIELRISDDELRGRNILLIDDVVTSGATMEECAKALREAGATRIECLVFALGG